MTRSTSSLSTFRMTPPTRLQSFASQAVVWLRWVWGFWTRRLGYNVNIRLRADGIRQELLDEVGAAMMRASCPRRRNSPYKNNEDPDSISVSLKCEVYMERFMTYSTPRQVAKQGFACAAPKMGVSCRI